MLSRKVRTTICGQYNALVTSVVKNSDGKVWAVEVFNIYSKRHECINLPELESLNSKEEVAAIVSNVLSGV